MKSNKKYLRIAYRNGNHKIRTFEFDLTDWCQQKAAVEVLSKLHEHIILQNLTEERQGIQCY